VLLGQVVAEVNDESACAGPKFSDTHADIAHKALPVKAVLDAQDVIWVED
jgi:hypothetical protein